MRFVTILLIILLVNGSANAEVGSFQQNQPKKALEPSDSKQISTFPDLAGLPLKVLKSSIHSELPVLVYICGDGGWNAFEDSLCRCLNRKGIPVVALDAKKYFWNGRSPAEATRDLVAIAETYQNFWHRSKFVLAGFSFGASLVPFLVNRLPQSELDRLFAALLISPDKNCDFEIHLSDMLNLGISKGKYDVIAEIESCKFKSMSVIFGSEENEDLRNIFQKTGVRTGILQGGHHFDSEFGKLADWIASEMKRK